VDKVQINVVKLKLFQRSINSPWDIFDVFDDFGCDKEIFAWNTGFLDCETQLGFGVVNLSSIEMTIA
jgi:hypothetical protein